MSEDNSKRLHAQWIDSPLPAMPRVLWEMRNFALVQSISDEPRARHEVLARFPLHAIY